MCVCVAVLCRECFQKAEALRLKQEQLQQERRIAPRGDEELSGGGASEMGEEGESGEDELLDELEMDWRAKHS